MTKTSALSKLMKDLESRGYPVWTGENRPARSLLSTYSAKVDEILGGGIVPGSVIEVSGPNGSGKSSLVASWLKDRDALWVALEYTDPLWIRRLGGNPVFVDPQSGKDDQRRFLGDDAWEAVRAAVQADVPFVVLDSLGALLPSGEDDKEMDEETRAGVARLIAKGLRRTMPHLRKSVLVLIAQVQDVQNSMYPMLKPKGGHAPAHFASAILEVRRKDVVYRQIEGVKTAMGQAVFVRTTKNKWAPPLRECLLYLGYDGTLSDDVPKREMPKTVIEKMEETAGE